MERLRQLRVSKGLTQAEIADMIGITRPAYTRYESGERSPSLDLLPKIAEIFNVSTDYLLGRSDSIHEQETPVTPQISADERAVDKMPDEKMEQALRRLGAIRPDGSIDEELLDIAIELLKVNEEVRRKFGKE